MFFSGLWGNKINDLLSQTISVKLNHEDTPLHAVPVRTTFTVLVRKIITSKSVLCRITERNHQREDMKEEATLSQKAYEVCITVTASESLSIKVVK